MNKHRGSNFQDYLKERSISEEVSALAKQRWAALRDEVSPTPAKANEDRDNSLSAIQRLFHRIRHGILHLFS